MAILSGSGPSSPSTGQVTSRAVVGIPWESIDFRVSSVEQGYPATLRAGESISLYYVEQTARGPLPVSQLDTVRVISWSVNAQSMLSPGTMDPTAASIRADTVSGGAVLTAVKPRHWIYPKPNVGVIFYESYLYSCKQGQCVKVYLVVP